MSCYTAAEGNVLLYPNLHVVTHLLFTWCLSSANCVQDPVLAQPQTRWCRGCGTDFNTALGGGAGGEWVSLLYALARGWGLGREHHVGETWESCSTTVAGIFKRPSPALGDMYMCLTNMEWCPHNFWVFLGKSSWGSPQAEAWGAAQAFPSGPF